MLADCGGSGLGEGHAQLSPGSSTHSSVLAVTHGAAVMGPPCPLLLTSKKRHL